MKVLDYEGVNGDQDKDELDITLRENPRVVHQKKRLSRPPVFTEPAPSSYMHGSYIGQRQTQQGQGNTEGHYIGDPPVVDENRSSSEATAIPPRSEQNGIADLDVPGDVEKTSLNRSEQMV